MIKKIIINTEIRFNFVLVTILIYDSESCSIYFCVHCYDAFFLSPDNNQPEMKSSCIYQFTIYVQRIVQKKIKKHHLHFLEVIFIIEKKTTGPSLKKCFPSKNHMIQKNKGSFPKKYMTSSIFFWPLYWLWKHCDFFIFQ